MKWEYKTIRVNRGAISGTGFEANEFDEFVNQFGDLGWELVSTVGNIDYVPLVGYSATSEILLFFKRPVENDK